MTFDAAAPAAPAAPAGPSAPAAPAAPAEPSAQRGPIDRYLARLHERHASSTGGAVADYIPELAVADPSLFGISIAMLSGAVHEVGDTRVPFSIQSIAKPLAFGLALETHGEAVVRARVGVEPTGDAFNATSISAATGLPMNPMVNAGAIAVAGLIAEDLAPLGQEFVLSLGHYVGHEVEIDERVRASESETGHRNRSLAHLLRGADAVNGDAEVALQSYLAACASMVDCRDLAVIAATLANDGVNPVTGQRVASSATVRSVLSVMATCGMYDGAGDWLYAIGLPAKSGVSGGIIAVLPGQLGIGVFSPPLDVHGNSVRGVEVCRDLSRDLDLHLLSSGPPVTPILETIVEHDGSVLTLRLQGDMGLTGVEAVSAALSAEQVRFGILDLTRVQRPRFRVLGMFMEVRELLRSRGGDIVLVGDRVQPDLVAALRAAVEARGGDGAAMVVHAELDSAVDWCTRRVQRDDA